MIHLPKGKVACTPIFDPDTSPTGLIIIPDMAKQRCDHGVVKYIGQHDPENTIEVKPGDLVLFSGYTGTLVAIEGEFLIIVPNAYITAIILPHHTDISGLYHKDESGEYFPATYESTIQLLAAGIHDAPWHSKLEIEVEKPKKEEVNWK